MYHQERGNFMEMSKTLPLSFMVHMILIAGVVLFSARSGNAPSEFVLSVYLASQEREDSAFAPIHHTHIGYITDGMSGEGNVRDIGGGRKNDHRDEVVPQVHPTTEAVDRFRKEERAFPIHGDGERREAAVPMPAGGDFLQSGSEFGEVMNAPAPHIEPEVTRNRGEGLRFAVGIIERIKEAIEHVKTYPLMARRRGMEGTVYVRFRINPEGLPEDISVVKSSGYRVLDRATLNVVKKAAPYPYIESRIEVPIVYRLED